MEGNKLHWNIFRQRKLEKQVEPQPFTPGQLNCRIWWSLTQATVKGLWRATNYIRTFFVSVN